MNLRPLCGVGSDVASPVAIRRLAPPFGPDPPKSNVKRPDQARKGDPLDSDTGDVQVSIAQLPNDPLSLCPAIVVWKPVREDPGVPGEVPDRRRRDPGIEWPVHAVAHRDVDAKGRKQQSAGQ